MSCVICYPDQYVQGESNVVSTVFQDMIEKLYTNPRKIFSLLEQPDTYNEVDMKTAWTILPAMTSQRPIGRTICDCVCTVRLVSQWKQIFSKIFVTSWSMMLKLTSIILKVLDKLWIEILIWFDHKWRISP